jgi:hypothetical protein
MSLSAFQAVSMRLYTDARFPEQVHADPLGELCDYALTEREKRVLLEMASARIVPLVQSFRESIYRKAFAVQWSTFHLVHDHFGMFKEGFFAAFRRSFTFERRSASRAIDDFADLLITTARSCELRLPESFVDVVRYDRACTRLAASGTSLVSHESACAEGVGSPAGGQHRIVHAPGVVVEEFGFDVPHLVAGGNPDGLPRGVFACVFVHNPDAGTVTVYRIGRLLITILKHTNEPVTLDRLIGAVASDAGPTPDVCLQAVRQLEARGVLVHACCG